MADCVRHDDGWHRSLFILNGIDHTCVCWLPNPPGSAGRRQIESNDRMRWKDSEVVKA